MRARKTIAGFSLLQGGPLLTFLAEEESECCAEIILSCILECKNPLRFHLIIDKKHFGGERWGTEIM